MAVIIFGASDDLVEIRGDIYEEFNPDSDERPSYLAFSDGTVLSVEYGRGGTWHIRRVVEGSAAYERRDAVDADAGSDERGYSLYSDRVTLGSTDGEIAWAVFGSRFEKQTTPPRW